MKFTKSIMLAVILIGILIWGIWESKYSSLKPLRFSVPTLAEYKGHDIAQAHLFFEGTEVPPMYCIVKDKMITIKAAPVPTNQTSTQYATVRLDWRDKNGKVVYRLTRIIPLTKEAQNAKPEFQKSIEWKVEPIN